MGVFDSGIGGLTVLQDLRRTFPQENFLYLADNAYNPYGDKPSEIIRARSENIIQWMIKKSVKLIIIACHTSSALVPSSEQGLCPVITMIKPTIQSILKQSFHQGLGIIATPLSTAQGTLVRALRSRGFLWPIYPVSCPGLVPLIEQSQWECVGEKAREYLSFFDTNPVDYIIYGCTHYPFINPFIDQKKYAPFIDPALAIAPYVQEILPLNTSVHAHEEGFLHLYHTGPLDPLLPHLKKIPFDSVFYLSNDELKSK